MSETLPSELANLPPPIVINEVDFEVRLTAFKTTLQAGFDAAGITYDVWALETDPAVIMMEVSGFQDIELRQSINEGVRTNLLPFAIGNDLDILAFWYDVSRLSGESDADLRNRIVLAIQGRSTGGTEARYKFIGMSADPRVDDIAVYTIGRDPTIQVAVFAKDNAGIADSALLSAVDTALQAPDVRMVNDIIVVASAAQTTIDVTARFWLLPQADAALIGDLETKLADAWAAELALGRDVTTTWLIAQLQDKGVHRVELVSPADDVSIPFNQAPALGILTLELIGRDF